MDINAIKEAAENFSHAELEACIEAHIANGSNTCYIGENAEGTIEVLSKASYMKQQIETGKAKDLTEAMRLLAASIRSISKK